LVNDMKAAGIAVLPLSDTLPETAIDAVAVIQAALAASNLAVHLLGEGRSVTERVNDFDTAGVEV
jgi:hypothetical protein